MARALVFVLCGVTYLTALAAPAGRTAGGAVLPTPEEPVGGPVRGEPEAGRQLNASALNAALAFGPYRALAGRRRHNLLFSPLGLAAALALLARASGSDGRGQALEALGLEADASPQSVEATLSALAHLQRRLAAPGGGGGQRAEAAAGIGAAPGAETGDGPEARNDTEGGGHPGGQLRVWSSLLIDGKPHGSFTPRPPPSSASNASADPEASGTLELTNYVYFKGRQPFARRHTVQRSFQLNATAGVEVAMMLGDDSSELMMLYDTTCSATVVRLAHSQRLASLLLLPKGRLQPLEGCLSHGRMGFWRSNLKPGRAEIRFPKFQLRKTHSLERLLRSSGVTAVFSHAANFSGISQKTLKITKAAQEVMLEVEETKYEDGGRPDILLDFSVPTRISFNRPFVLIVYDDLTGLVLLMGRVMDPTPVEHRGMDPTPVDRRGMDPTPVDRGVMDPTPVEHRVMDPTPVELRVMDPTPVDRRGMDPTPVEHRVMDPTPVEHRVMDPTPVEHRVMDPTPVDRRVMDPTPVELRVMDPTPVDRRGMDPTPVEHRGMDPTPVEHWVMDPTPVDWSV